MGMGPLLILSANFGKVAVEMKNCLTLISFFANTDPDRQKRFASQISKLKTRSFFVLSHYAQYKRHYFVELLYSGSGRQFAWNRKRQFLP